MISLDGVHDSHHKPFITVPLDTRRQPLARRRLHPGQPISQFIGYILLGHYPVILAHMHIARCGKLAQLQVMEIEVRRSLLESTGCRENTQLLEFIIRELPKAFVHAFNVICAWSPLNRRAFGGSSSPRVFTALGNGGK
jgi:hypothetical protein